MLLLKPKLSILDEIDSGLDIDALKIILRNVLYYHNKNNAVIFITHYSEIFNYIQTHHLHVLIKGMIVKSGGNELIEYIKYHGYQNFDVL